MQRALVVQLMIGHHWQHLGLDKQDHSASFLSGITCLAHMLEHSQWNLPSWTERNQPYGAKLEARVTNGRTAVWSLVQGNFSRQGFGKRYCKLMGIFPNWDCQPPNYVFDITALWKRLIFFCWKNVRICEAEIERFQLRQWNNYQSKCFSRKTPVLFVDRLLLQVLRCNKKFILVVSQSVRWWSRPILFLPICCHVLPTNYFSELSCEIFPFLSRLLQNCL